MLLSSSPYGIALAFIYFGFHLAYQLRLLYMTRVTVPLYADFFPAAEPRNGILGPLAPTCSDSLCLSEVHVESFLLSVGPLWAYILIQKHVCMQETPSTVTLGIELL